MNNFRIFHEQAFVFPVSAIRRRSWLPIRQKTAVLDNGMVLDWRVDLRSHMLYLRIRKITTWMPIFLVWTGKRGLKVWKMSCPSCDSTVPRLFIRRNALPSCSHCSPLPKARTEITQNSIVKKTLKLIDANDMQSIKKLMSNMGDYPFRVRQALELRGLLPSLYAPKTINLRRYWQSKRTNGDNRNWDGPNNIVYAEGEVLCRKELHSTVGHTSFLGGQEEEAALRIIEDLFEGESDAWHAEYG